MSLLHPCLRPLAGCWTGACTKKHKRGTVVLSAGHSALLSAYTLEARCRLCLSSVSHGAWPPLPATPLRLCHAFSFCAFARSHWFRDAAFKDTPPPASPIIFDAQAVARTLGMAECIEEMVAAMKALSDGTAVQPVRPLSSRAFSHAPPLPIPPSPSLSRSLTLTFSLALSLSLALALCVFSSFSLCDTRIRTHAFMWLSQKGVPYPHTHLHTTFFRPAPYSERSIPWLLCSVRAGPASC